MIRRVSRLAVTVTILAASAPGLARATMVPRAEKGAVVVIAGPPQGLESPVLVKRGDAAWTQSVRPAYAVRLLDPLAERKVPHGSAIAQGAALFGYTLSSGLAYCPPLPHDGPSPQVQCLRDFNADNSFDGCYIGDTRGLHSHFSVGLVSDLNACGHHRFQPIDWPADDQAKATILFKGFRKGFATFQIQLEDQKLDSVDYCAPQDDGSCSIMDMRLRITAEGDGARIALVSAKDERRFAIYSTGGPDLPNLGQKQRTY